MSRVELLLKLPKPKIGIKIAPLGLQGYFRILILIAAICVMAARLYYGIFQTAPADAVGNSLGSMSVAGSIITGLCITGVSTMDGGLLKRLTRTYGEHLRSVFFAWFTFVSAIIIGSGVLHAMPDNIVARLVASFLPPALFVAVTGLAYSVFKLYRVEEEIVRGEEVKAEESAEEILAADNNDSDNDDDSDEDAAD